MAVKRQDAWMAEDDMVLAEVTLRHIREGGTQLAAFEEVAQRLGRTPAACGFRWNSSVRKKYEAAIQIAKAQRQKRSQERRISYTTYTSREDHLQDPNYSLDHIIRFLRQHKNEVGELRRQQKQLEKELQEREEQMERLERENYAMKSQLDSMQNNYQVVNDDYRTLIQIMERARKMTILDEEENGMHKAKFRMETNGNLERIDK
ncbi:RsfA family transcriptional regulator [Thermoflavimicrobium daqui]|jgi:prespore-specific regulator|uniref:RsfA family transcriptional regulator n=1 Tax=Thermoflavimicrobium daqui TaxID=2137476 RepID=A0A364K6U2_9BACL|nr:RsfA family transcriptional regulator [Thermoflavimicrobium daqui]RAL25997.1 RsfA family transcriptional regulator [Thermoflavimicrobium daqui]